MKSLTRRDWLLLTPLLLAAFTGCSENSRFAAPGSFSPADLTPANEIYRLICGYQPPFWKNYRPERVEEIEGFKFNLYCISRQNGEGVLTDGTLQTRLYLRRRLNDGTLEREQICDWAQSLMDTPRTRQKMVLGWVYQPHYFWGDLDMAGQEIEIVVWLEAADGRKVHAKPRILRVPERSRA